MQPNPVPRGRLMSFENPREYRKQLAGLTSALDPRDDFDRAIVEEFAQARWEWNRARAIDCDFWDYAGSSYNRGIAGLAEAQLYSPEKQLRPHRIYMLDCERRYYRALRAVEQMRRDRSRSAEPRISAASLPDDLPSGRVIEMPAPILIDPLACEKRNEPNPLSPPHPAAILAVRNEPNSAALAPEPAERKEPNRASAATAAPRVAAKRNEPNPSLALSPAPAILAARNEPVSAALASEPAERNEPNPAFPLSPAAIHAPQNEPVCAALALERAERNEPNPPLALSPEPAIVAARNEPNLSARARNEANRILRRASRKRLFAPPAPLPAGPTYRPAPEEPGPREPFAWHQQTLVIQIIRRPRARSSAR